MVRHLTAVTLLWLLGLTSCASFGYKHYQMELPNYEGMLIGKEESEDIPFERCKPIKSTNPDQPDERQCIIMFISEFELMRMELEDLRSKKSCE